VGELTKGRNVQLPAIRVYVSAADYYKITSRLVAFVSAEHATAGNIGNAGCSTRHCVIMTRYLFDFSMSSDTSSSSRNPSSARSRRRGNLGGLGRAVKQAKRPPQVNDSAGDESDECTDSDLCELSSSNETSDTTDAEANRYTLYYTYFACSHSQKK